MRHGDPGGAALCNHWRRGPRDNENGIHQRHSSPRVLPHGSSSGVKPQENRHFAGESQYPYRLKPLQEKFFSNTI